MSGSVLTLTTFGAVVQSYVDQGVLTRNAIALVERARDTDTDAAEPTAKSWTLTEAERFRAAMSDHRLFAGSCRCTGCAGPRCLVCVGALSISTPARCRSGAAGSPWAAKR